MKKKITVLTLCVVLLTFSFPVEAQQTAKIPRIGYVSGTGSAAVETGRVRVSTALRAAARWRAVYT